MRRAYLPRALYVLVSLILIASAVVWVVAGNLTSPAPQSIGDLPKDLNGWPVQFQSSSGTTIHGWLIPGVKGAGAIALMHGVRSNRLSMLARARFLSQAGYTVLLFDFQAHGESQGKHITFGKLESKDAEVAIQFLRQNAPGEKIGVVGESMGGAAAILASPPLNADAMILEMVYPTIEEAVSNRIATRFGNWSRILTGLLVLQLRPRLGINPEELRPIDSVGGITCPKLFIAGSKDRYTPLEESQRLYDTAAAPKEFWVVEGAGHQDLHNAAKTEYENRVLSFFQQRLR